MVKGKVCIFIKKKCGNKLKFIYRTQSWNNLKKWKGALSADDFEEYVSKFPMEDNSIIELNTENYWNGYLVQGHPFYRKEA